MESWEVLSTAIPRSASGRVAQLLGVGADYIRKWRREPESDDAPTATGQRSILDRICDLIDAVFLVHPAGCGLIVQYINSHYNNLMQVHAKPLETHECRAVEAADLLQEATEAVNSLNVDGCKPTTIEQLVQLRDATARAISRVEASMKKENHA